jgi:hypothetical protein
MQQLPGLRIDGGGIVEELIRVLVAHDPRQLGRGVVELQIADQIALATGQHLLLHIGERHHLRELLRLAAGAEADIDGHVVAGFPASRIDIDPGIAQPHRLKLLAVLADGGVQQREHVPHAFGHEAGDQLHPHLRGVEDWRDRGGGLVLQGVGVDALGLLGQTRAGFELAVELTAIISENRLRRGAEREPELIPHPLPQRRNALPARICSSPQLAQTSVQKGHFSLGEPSR